MKLDESHIFEICGVASLSAVFSKECKEIFSKLEEYQNTFLEYENKFRSPEYKWPRDALHNWSRIWEYPYVYYQLCKFYRKVKKLDSPKVLDFGSGVTFFPFSVAKLGYEVMCADIDPTCERDLKNAINVIDCSPGRVDVQLVREEMLPFEKNEFDIIYSISVIEHIKFFEPIIDEFVRILKPMGFLILTIDLDIRGDSHLTIGEYNLLINKIKKYFDFVYPERTIHPADILTSCNSPYGFRALQGFPRIKFFLKQQIIKPLLRKKPSQMYPFHLAIACFSLIKRS